MYRLFYTDLLHDNVCVCVFEKVDGTKRTMICTLQSDQLPIKESTGSTYVVPDYQVRCFDVQKQAWRSFNIDSVISFEISQ